ncbi:MAG: ACP S-malonyltransferase [Actinomycetota bacterium]|jgi:[acyl-carrier-protein] S-malonyltransferase|nr:ACP S-malonyltransferase [Actinomycetota bacterium]
MVTRTAIVFPGQGSQRPGMLDAVPDHDSLGRLLDAAEALSGLNLKRIATDGSAEELSDTVAAQPLLYLADWVWGVTLLDSGVEPIAMAGHSLGELAALAVAGVFSAEAGLELVVERSKLMAAAVQATPGGMSAVLGMPAQDIVRVLDDIDDVWIANDNAPGQVVISGTVQGVREATDSLLEAGAKRVVPLPVAGAFHSPIMEPARSAFADLLSSTEFLEAHVPIIQNTMPEMSVDPTVIKERLSMQIAAPVRWTDTMAALVAEGPITLIEAGPGAVLKGLARRVDGIQALSVETAGLEAIVEEVL